MRASVRLRQALLRGLRELRKWDLAPLGAVLVVCAGAALLFIVIATGGGPGNAALVRGYFASHAGGSAPRDQAKRISVGDCQATRDSVDDNVVWTCPVTFRGQTYHPCFAWAGGTVIKGSRELGNDHGCDRVVWSRAVGALVVA
jgi:hypothetical protein